MCKASSGHRGTCFTRVAYDVDFLEEERRPSDMALRLLNSYPANELVLMSPSVNH